MKRVSDNVWEAVYTNIEPETYTDCITIILGNIFGDTNKQSLFWYTKPQLRLLRNAIYAFNGYPFKSKDLIDLFEADCAEYGWFGFKEIDGDYKGYYPLDNNFSEDKLSDIEKHNVNLILEEEKSR